ncbi:MAG: hypothetical protein MUF54_20510, partial [Polyangiaceae bacterium]|nr:hypothetical protein [Polyangiaceae bacterium]
QVAPRAMPMAQTKVRANGEQEQLQGISEARRWRVAFGMPVLRAYKCLGRLQIKGQTGRGAERLGRWRSATSSSPLSTSSIDAFLGVLERLGAALSLLGELAFRQVRRRGGLVYARGSAPARP